MNVEPLFRRFDELADAPERIPALRKVILAYLLHSAVNSPDAISRAATLREAHELRRRGLIKNASRKDVPTVPEVVEEDLPPSLSDIPAVLFDRLGNIASIEKGLSQIQSTKPGKYPLVVTAETRSSSESFDFEGAAAIIPLVSSTGHGDASLKRLHYQEGRYAVGNILAVVKPICPDLLRARFIYEYLSAFKEELLVSRMVGTANVSLTVNKLKEVPVPLVSGPVLSRIDELMALCDRLEAQQQERETRHAALARASLARFADAPTPANLHFLFHPSYAIPPADLRKSILTLAVQGKLVPQDPNDEPAEVLLANINRERLAAIKARRISPMKPLPPVEEGEIAYDLRPGRALARLIELVMEIQTGPFGSSLHQSDYQVGGTPVINPASLKDGRVVPIESMAIGADTLKRLEVFRLKEGDIVMARRGEMGRCAIVTKAEDGWLCGTGSLVLRMPTGMYGPFLALLIGAPEAREYLSGASVGTTMQNLNQGILAKMPVGVPPRAEQRRIVAKVEQLMALVDALEQQLAASRATGETLLQALVSELTNTQAMIH